MGQLKAGGSHRVPVYSADSYLSFRRRRKTGDTGIRELKSYRVCQSSKF